MAVCEKAGLLPTLRHAGAVKVGEGYDAWRWRKVRP